MAITFEVSRVARAQAPLRISPSSRELRLQDQRVEAMGANVAAFLPASAHGLLRAVHTAYALHYPLVLTPDTVWLAIAQGFAMHVNANAELLRGKFVRHARRATITIQRDDFVKGSPDNRWPEAFGMFSDAVAEHIGRQRDLVVCDFSTTGPSERAASEIVLLDAMQSYFKYRVLTRCGIPEITLDGTADDWRSIRRRARALEEYELTWWTDALGPVLDQLVATAEGRVDVPFWKAFFKHEDGSGGPWIRGWINVLFPYVRSGPQQTLVPHETMTAWTRGLEERGGGATPLEIPSGLSLVPFNWTFPLVDRVLPMEFLAGFVGVAQDEGSLAIRPAIGWAVRDAVVAAEAPAASENRARDPREDHPQVGARFGAKTTLIAGRMTGEVSLTFDEAIDLCARMDPLEEVVGAPLAFIPVGNLTTAAAFPESPLSLRIVVGLRVAYVIPGGSRNVDVEELRGALDRARALPEATWRRIAENLPSELQGTASLHLAVCGTRGSGELLYGERHCSLEVRQVSTEGTSMTEVDVSSEAHDRRAQRLDRLGVSGARYWLRMG
jgi:uncharacterized protein DUF4419